MNYLNFANPKLQDIHIDLRLRPRKNLLTGTLLIFSSLLVAISGLLIIMLLTAAKLGCLILLAMVGTITAVTQVGRLARRYFINPQKVLLKDHRDPVLYLRSFYDDYEEISQYQNKKTPEEVLASVLHSIGPVIAVGKPEDSDLPLLGATRIYLKDTNWQPCVERLISISQLVVMHPEFSVGVLWELDAVKRLVKAERLLISFLHWQTKSQYGGLERQDYEKFANRFYEIFGHTLPEWTRNTTFVYFESDWTSRSIEIIPKNPFFNPWIPFIPLSYSSYYPISTIRGALIPLFRQRGMIQW